MSLKNGNQLKAARVLAGLSQRELAREAGLHANSVKNWEGKTGTIGGYAVRCMVDALKRRGVHCGVEHAEGRKIAVLRS